MPNFVHKKVDPNRLSVTAGNIDNSLNVLDNAFRTVDDALRNTLDLILDGPASRQFFQQYALDALAFAAYMKKPQELNQQLKEAAGIFDNADNKARDLLAKLQIS